MNERVSEDYHRKQDTIKRVYDRYPLLSNLGIGGLIQQIEIGLELKQYFPLVVPMLCEHGRTPEPNVFGKVLAGYA